MSFSLEKIYHKINSRMNLENFDLKSKKNELELKTLIEPIIYNVRNNKWQFRTDGANSSNSTFSEALLGPPLPIFYKAIGYTTKDEVDSSMDLRWGFLVRNVIASEDDDIRHWYNRFGWCREEFIDEKGELLNARFYYKNTVEYFELEYESKMLTISKHSEYSVEEQRKENYYSPYEEHKYIGWFEFHEDGVLRFSETDIEDGATQRTDFGKLTYVKMSENEYTQPMPGISFDEWVEFVEEHPEHKDDFKTIENLPYWALFEHYEEMLINGKPSKLADLCSDY